MSLLCLPLRSLSFQGCSRCCKEVSAELPISLAGFSLRYVQSHPVAPRQVSWHAVPARVYTPPWLKNMASHHQASPFPAGRAGSAGRLGAVSAVTSNWYTDIRCPGLPVHRAANHRFMPNYTNNGSSPVEIRASLSLWTDSSWHVLLIFCLKSFRSANKVASRYFHG
jgi:hypothetical protein